MAADKVGLEHAEPTLKLLAMSPISKWVQVVATTTTGVVVILGWHTLA